MADFIAKTREMADGEGRIPLGDRHDDVAYLSFDRAKKRESLLTWQGTFPSAIGENLIAFLALDEGALGEYEADRLRLAEEMKTLDTGATAGDFSQYLDSSKDDYIKKTRMSPRELAKKLAVMEFIRRHEALHPYLKTLGLFSVVFRTDTTELVEVQLNLGKQQERIAGFVAFCLDADTPQLNALSPEKRYYFYCATGRELKPNVFRTKLVPSPNWFPVERFELFYKKPIQEMLEGDVKLDKAMLEYLGTPQTITPEAVDYLSKTDAGLLEAVEIRSVEELVDAELYQMVLLHTKVRRCGICGKYFLLKGTGTSKYCSRVQPGYRQSCQLRGAGKDYSDRPKSQAKIAYTRVYKKMYARIRYGLLTREAFDAWNGQALAQLHSCEEGGLDLECFQLWLDATDDET